MPRISTKRKIKGRNRWAVEANSGASQDNNGQDGCLSTHVSSDTDDTSSAAGSYQALTALAKKLASTSKMNATAEAYNTAPSEGKSYRLVQLSSLMKTFEQLHKCRR